MTAEWWRSALQAVNVLEIVLHLQRFSLIFNIIHKSIKTVRNITFYCFTITCQRWSVEPGVASRRQESTQHIIFYCLACARSRVRACAKVTAPLPVLVVRSYRSTVVSVLPVLLMGGGSGIPRSRSSQRHGTPPPHQHSNYHREWLRFCGCSSPPPQGSRGSDHLDGVVVVEEEEERIHLSREPEMLITSADSPGHQILIRAKLSYLLYFTS